ncbi:hypothetical protein CKO15_09370 [Halorhodospira abdelmalekii]|uniref:translocation/assembly module TamB domain-containing protein n=1 Tax=Halorhodospira abdelmalekii TaxID=421629 RepID=UPI0019056701|nr:translocation/assembly module TamB domain-containing protein [Halorhodospira abdelmalekii]MBK1735488.1 hypothetical protein [Halorhodospira abdelmalekii]
MARRWRRGLAWGSGGLLGLVALLLLAVWWLLYTTAGAQLIAYVAQTQEPRLQLQVRDGSLIRGVEAHRVAWRDEALQVEIEQLQWRWHPWELLERRGRIESLEARGVAVTLPEGEAEAETAAELEEALQTPRQEPIALPQIDLPLTVELEQLRIERVRLQLGGAPVQWIQRLEGQLAGAGSSWQIKRLMVEREDARLDLHGDLRTVESYPLNLFVRASAAIPGLPERVRLASRLGGSVAALQSSLSLAGPVEGDFELALRPLDPRLPFRLDAFDVSGGWPLATQDLVQAEALTLSVHGDLERISGALSAEVGGEEIPHGVWEADFNVDPQRGAEIERLEGRLLDGVVRARGEVAWAPQLQWQAAIDLHDLSPAQQWPAAPERVAGPLQVSGKADAQGWSLDLVLERLHGELEGRHVELAGRLGHRDTGAWFADGVRAKIDGGALALDGEWADAELTLDLALHAEDLSVLHPDLGGAVEAQARVRGEPLRASVQSAGWGRDLRYGEAYQLAELEWQADVPALGMEPGEVTLVARQATLGGQAVGGQAGQAGQAGEGEQAGEADQPEQLEQTIETLEVSAFGTRASHQLTARASAPQGNARLAIAGGWLEGRGWHGMIADAGGEALGHALDLDRPFMLRQEGEVVQVSPHCWRYRDGRLCVAEPVVASPEAVTTRLALHDFELAWLEPWLPELVRWQGGLSGEGWLDWQQERGLLAELDLESRDGRIELAVAEAIDDLPPVVRDLDYERLTLSGRLDPETAGLQLDFLTREAGQIALQLAADPNPDLKADGWLAGELQVSDLQLGFFHPFIPELRELEGRFDAAIELAGTRHNPELDGTLTLADGRVAVPESPTTIDELALSIALQTTQAQLSGGFVIDGRPVRLSGEADWAQLDAWQLDVALAGRRLPIEYPPLAQLVISPDLTLRMQPEQVRVRGSVEVPRGAITVAELPQQAVARSGDVVIVRRRDEERRPESVEESAVDSADEREATAAAAERADEALAIDAAIDIRLGDAVQLAAFGVRGTLAGTLQVRQLPGAEPAAFGELRIVDGEYRGYGQRLAIRRGMVMFVGPLDRPQLNIEAVRRIERDRVTAGLRIQGDAPQPVITLFSEPAMGEEDALSYLIRGRPLGAEGAGTDAMLAQAALSLGVMGGGRVLGGVAEQLGVEDFEIDTAGEGDEAQVVVSGYVGSPRLRVSYGVGVFQPVNTLRLRYYLTWKTYLEAVSSEESSLDLMRRFEID